MGRAAAGSVGSLVRRGVGLRRHSESRRRAALRAVEGEVRDIVRIDFQFRNHEEGDGRFREQTEPRLQHLLRQYERIQGIKVAVSHQRGRYTVDLTVEVAGALLRAEERRDDALGAFDKTLERVERQLERFKARTKDFAHESLRTLATEQTADLMPPREQPEGPPGAPEAIRIVRTKAHLLKPMTPEEAALQMELLGHDFFVFVDGDTQRVGVVYRRRQGGYGLIEPEVSEL